jgi:methyl-accepting chemotaxis protein
MNWFNNLNAKPRLMCSFGVLLVLSMGISYLAVSGLSKANDRVRALYQQDLKGVIAIEDISTNKLDMARQDRDAMVNIDNQAVRTADLDALKADFVSMHSNLHAAELCFNAPEEKAAIGNIRDILPGYESAVMLIVDAIAAKNLAGAQARLLESTSVAAQMTAEITNARKVKETVAEEEFEANNQAYETARILILCVAAASLLLGIILSILIARGFSLPLGQAMTALERVAEGDLTVTLDVDTRDEVGRMGMALNAAVERLNNTMQEVADTAGSASSSSQQLAAAAEAIASGAQEQAASLEETSASLEEITASVRQSADNAQQASQLAVGSKDSATQGQEVVSKAITAMEEINAASAKISDIISTIDEIAFQTNLLAVNAAVEAARAGDEGRGFAVVASEVRSLAQRSAVAAKEIKVLIQDSLRKVDAGSALVNRSGETLQGIVGSVKRVTDIVGEIAASSAEQSTGVEQVSKAMTQMDQVTQSNSTQTEELSATAQSLSEQSARLLELVGTFTLSQRVTDTRDRRRFQPRESEPAQFVGASLLQAAKSIPVHSAPHLNSTAKLGQRPVRSTHNAASTQSEGRSRPGKSLSGRQPALVTAALTETDASDASFEEF